MYHHNDIEIKAIWENFYDALVDNILDIHFTVVLRGFYSHIFFVVIFLATIISSCC